MVAFLVFLAIGFVIDEMSGAVTENTKFIHSIAGLFGALGVIYGLVIGAIALVGGVIIYQESRIR